MGNIDILKDPITLTLGGGFFIRMGALYFYSQKELSDKAKQYVENLEAILKKNGKH